jgi:prephenate dehydrogenase
MTSPSSTGSNDPGLAGSGEGEAAPLASGGMRRAAVIGTGLIGGSVGMALRRLGWLVSGVDKDPAKAQRALELGAIDRVGDDPAAAATFIAVPAGAVAEVAKVVLAHQDEHYATAPSALAPSGPKTQVVTDVASVKEGIVTSIGHPRFVGGHPMAGSEQEGVDGAAPDLFLGATWVLTPGQYTSGEAYSEVQALVRQFGANPVALEPRRHDELVALVSHTPHLTAAALMNLAADAAASDSILLRLAAGGFRDMTRVAAGDPGMWPDVVAENQDAILSALDRLSASLDQLRTVVAARDRGQLLELLQRARHARINLPTGAPALSQASELRLPVPDRPGVIAEVSTLLGGLGVNIFDVEIAHSAEGDRGVLVLIVDASAEDVARKALAQRGYRASARRLEP